MVLGKNLKQILTLKPQYIQKAVKRSIEIKADVVTKDEKELGLRAILNFGHTFGHALETIGENKLYTHGEAVALGMLAACKLSEISDDFSEKSSERISSLIKKTGIGVKLKKKINHKKLIKLMQSDKKSNQGRLKFILLEKIGRAKIKVIKNNQVIEKAIKNKVHVITPNKALIAKHGDYLSKLAEKYRVNLEFEASVAGGIPIVRSIKESLATNRIFKVYGILNGTCNYILSKMENDNKSFKTPNAAPSIKLGNSAIRPCS